MKRIVRVCTIVFIAAMLPECSGFIGKESLHTRYYPGTGEGEALIVLLPTIGGDGSHYEKQGLIEDLRSRGALADVVALNVKPRLYLGRRIVNILKTEVIVPAKHKGYRLIILVGTSLGGHGALLYATEYPEDVDGVFLFAPFISGPKPTRAIQEAGGLANWQDCPFLAWEYACNLWRALRDYVSVPERRARIFLGYGTEDRFANECRALAETLPPENVFTVEGGHDWVTWEKLWVKMLEYLDIAKPFQRGR